jgi:hypothetical protein
MPSDVLDTVYWNRFHSAFGLDLSVREYRANCRGANVDQIASTVSSPVRTLASYDAPSFSRSRFSFIK